MINQMQEVAAPLHYKWDDGGREEAGYRGKTGDCAVRAMAIVTGRPYREIYKAFRPKNPNRTSNYGKGLDFEKIDQFLSGHYGFRWVERRLNDQRLNRSLPYGTLVVMLHQHVCAVIDHTIHDTFDPARGGVLRPKVLGYWV